MLEQAILLATKAHAGQKDKGKKPYILHPLRVMLRCEGEVEQIAAVLHDILEDTAVTEDLLLQEGFSEEIVEVVKCLTRREGEEYFHYITRISENDIARRVKLADLADNMDMSRIPMPREKDWIRLEKYQKARELLEKK